MITPENAEPRTTGTSASPSRVTVSLKEKEETQRPCARDRLVEDFVPRPTPSSVHPSRRQCGVVAEHSSSEVRW